MTHSRRMMLKASIALSLATPVVAAPTAGDAEVIRLCAAFDVLERQYQAEFRDVEAGEEWDRADAAADLIREQQEPILDAICACRPSTPEGFRALANSLVLQEGELLKQDPGEGGWNDRLARLLLRGITGRV